ncbi:MAG: hypothetical protein HY608_02925 [Planctomycetes bacterium]|nr:hypothetical protein [Planctomycetota bacterium]
MLSAIDGAAHTAHLETYILKILAVDGKVAFVGGLNIADAYAPTEDGGEGWRDNHARIEGPSAARLDDEFLENTP